MRTMTLKEVLEGAEAAHRRVLAWPEWKRDLSGEYECMEDRQAKHGDIRVSRTGDEYTVEVFLSSSKNFDAVWHRHASGSRKEIYEVLMAEAVQFQKHANEYIQKAKRYMDLAELHK
jgi:hypothetical protein